MHAPALNGEQDDEKQELLALMRSTRQEIERDVERQLERESAERRSLQRAAARRGGLDADGRFRLAR
jgi:hypothetical protein